MGCCNSACKAPGAPMPLPHSKRPAHIGTPPLQNSSLSAPYPHLCSVIRYHRTHPKEALLLAAISSSLPAAYSLHTPSMHTPSFRPRTHLSVQIRITTCGGKSSRLASRESPRLNTKGRPGQAFSVPRLSN
jgi:hypothetical protein